MEEVIYINGSDKTVVIMKTNGDPLGLGRVYYETENAGMFHPNAKFMYDMRLFENGDRKIERINGYAAVNISYFKESDFRKFNVFMDKLFNLMQQQGMV